MTTALLTPAEAAGRLRCSTKTLADHVHNGRLKYVIIGAGKKRPRRMFTDADVDEFIERQTRRDVPWQRSTSPRARRTTTSTSAGEVIGFTALRERRNAEKQKR